MTESDNTNDWLPLFPLQTVLFPDGILPLKIFETRYVDMVRECMRNEKPFGVVAIRTGKETGATTQPEAVGCLANIVHWDMEAGGLLMIRTQGGLRFRIRETRVLADGRMEGLVDYLAEDTLVTTDPMLTACAAALKAITDDFDQRVGQDNPTDYPFATPLRFGDMGWVANRWSEILPMPLPMRQALLETADVAQRLAIIMTYLKQQQILTT
ncbi:LON peptidase substrate-binding domain-containing protein [Actimicrobium antarcticum]|uniref:LON peptidase substrate-binding domain-containing protein n=1 Tax=Actimicrobium antarcticum TaxID=1051899 RepID=A0ABP7T9S0_9BURK